MKKLWFCLVALAIFSFSSCDLFDKISEDDNDLGGDTDIPLNQTGNTFSTFGNVNGTYVNVNSSITISQTDNGVAKMAVVADLMNYPELAKFNDLIPSIYKDQQGRVNTEMKFKMTSEGIQDYANLDGEAFTMVKYDCKVGDTYKLKKTDGKTITRTVTQKSTEDDYYYGLLMIKTMTVEQDSRIPGISKIVYRFNHKFGLVAVEVIAEDGSNVSSQFFPSSY
jgi:hypothetical protein